MSSVTGGDHRDLQAGKSLSRLPDSYAIVASVVSEDESAEALARRGEGSGDIRTWPASAKAIAGVIGLFVLASVLTVVGLVTTHQQAAAPGSLRKATGSSGSVQVKEEYSSVQPGVTAAGAVSNAGYYYNTNDNQGLEQVVTDASTAAAPLGYYNEPVPVSQVGMTTATNAGAGSSGYMTTPYGQVSSQPGSDYSYGDGVATTSNMAAASYAPPATGAGANALSTPNYWAGYTDAQMQAMYTTITITTTMRPDSLFCFALMMPTGYEKGLIRKLHERGESIFACDDYTVFSETDVEITPGPPVRIVAEAMGSMKCEYGGPFKLALNTDVFIRAWRKVFDDGKFLKHAWTVKVDPDCVFLPSRLRQRVVMHKPDEASYLNNCDQGLHGPIEVVSRGGMEAFRSGIDKCNTDKKLVDEKGTGGEDVFLRHCFALIEILKLDDFKLLSEQACFWEDPVKNGCTSGKVSFHPFKDPESYFKCLDQAKQDTTKEADPLAAHPELPA